MRAREGFANGLVWKEGRREAEDEAIRHVIDRQRQVGLEIFTDGEFRRASWITDMADAVEGFVPQSRTLEWRALGGDRELEASTSNVVGGRLKPRRRLTGDQTAFLKQ